MTIFLSIVVFATVGFTFLSETQRIEMIRNKNVLLQDEDYDYAGRSIAVFADKCLKFTNGVNDFYVSEDDFRVNYITSAGFDSEGSMIPESVLITKDEATEIAKKWFTAIFPDTEDMEIKKDSANSGIYTINIKEVNNNTPTGNEALLEIGGDGRLIIATILYETNKANSIEISKEKAIEYAIAAVNDLNRVNYPGIIAISELKIRNLTVELKVLKGTYFYRIEFFSPVISNKYDFEEFYSLDIDAASGECIAIANTYQNGYNKW